MSENKHYRMLTAASLFDGHDAAINLYRRLFQNAGFEVVHIGHNRSAQQVVTAAIQEDAHAVCLSSYQGGHVLYFQFVRDLLNEAGAEDVAIFGGGGGTILPKEIAALHDYGIDRIYHPEDGRKMGLEGIIADVKGKIRDIQRSESYYQTILGKLGKQEPLTDSELSKCISLMDSDEHPHLRGDFNAALEARKGKGPLILGITGPGGAGKSSLVDELVNRYLYCSKGSRVGILAFDPSKKKTGGALLGDRIRMNSIYDGRVFSTLLSD